METTDFEDVLREACEEVNLDPENLSAQDLRSFRRSAKKRLEMAWEYHFWPVLGRVEQRYFRDDWDAATSYGAATAGQDNSANEVFYPPTQLYYQSLRGTIYDTDTVIVTGAGNPGYNGTYTLGGDPAYPLDYYLSGTIYLHDGSLIDRSGEGSVGYAIASGVTGIYDFGGEEGAPYPTVAYSATSSNLNQPPADADGNTNDAYWAVSYSGAYTAAYLPGGVPQIFPCTSAQDYDSTATYERGDQVTYAGRFYQLFAASATGVLPTVTTSWGLLTAFDAYVAYEQTGQTAIGIVHAAYSANPRTTTRGMEVNWSLSEHGLQVHTPIPFVWTDYRIRCPKLGGDLWAGDKVYTAGQQIYFSSSSTPGNFFTCVTTTAAGESPDTVAEKWAVVELPRIFHKYLVLGMAADFTSSKDPDKGLRLGLADNALADQKSLLVGQQSQRIKTVVETR